MSVLNAVCQFSVLSGMLRDETSGERSVRARDLWMGMGMGMGKGIDTGDYDVYLAGFFGTVGHPF